MGLTLLASPTSMTEGPAPPAGAPLTPTQEGPVATYSTDYKADAVEFTLGPYEYVEYKYDLEKGASLLVLVDGERAGDPGISRRRGRQRRQASAEL